MTLEPIFAAKDFCTFNGGGLVTIDEVAKKQKVVGFIPRVSSFTKLMKIRSNEDGEYTQAKTAAIRGVAIRGRRAKGNDKSDRSFMATLGVA